MRGDVLTVFDGGVRLSVRVKPGSKRLTPLQIVDIGEGQRALEVAVAAAAQDGKANRAVIERLAALWGLPKNRVRIKSGTNGRLKILEIAGDPILLRTRLGF